VNRRGQSPLFLLGLTLAEKPGTVLIHLRNKSAFRKALFSRFKEAEEIGTAVDSRHGNTERALAEKGFALGKAGCIMEVS